MSKSNTIDTARRRAVKGTVGLPFALTMAGSHLPSYAGPADSTHYLKVRDLVGDPQDLFFTVEFPGKKPIKLVGHFWFNAKTVKAGRKCPAIVDFVPYRRRDGTMLGDAKMYPWYAYNDYLCLRVDLHGSGDSEGFMADEYSDEEISYCIQVINQIAKHPYCDGHVGMMGKSWGAINSFMTAARKDRPAALKAVIVCAGSDDRFNDDVHYMGGAMMADNFSWPASMWAWMAQPPDPAVVGNDWKRIWKERVDNAQFMFKDWGGHQSRDAYWSDTSVRDHYDDIGIPVFILSGWQDGYKNPVEHAVSELGRRGKTVQGLLGPWGHKYPFNGAPGPSIDWLQYSLTHWWDKWLKGKQPDPQQQWPELPVWLSPSQEPSKSACGDEKGKWVAEDHRWRERSKDQVLYLNAGHTLATTAQQAATYKAASTRPIGSAMLETSSWGECGNDDLPGDEALADRLLLGKRKKGQAKTTDGTIQFDGEPFTADLDIFGYPTVTLTMAADQALGSLAIRLSEISPVTGAAHIVNYTFFNLCHRGGDFAKPQHLVPGEVFTVTIPLSIVGHTFKKGWRVRLSVSPSFFPMMWAPPKPLSITVFAGPQDGKAASSLSLPVRAARVEDALVQKQISAVSTGVYVNPDDYLPILKEARPSVSKRTATRVKLKGKLGARVTKLTDSGRYQYGGPLKGLWVDQILHEECDMVDGDPMSMNSVLRSVTKMERKDIRWQIRSETIARLWSAQTASGAYEFCYSATVRAYFKNAAGKDELLAETQRTGAIARDWV